MLRAKRGGRTRCGLGACLCFAVDGFGAAPVLNQGVDIGLAVGGVAAQTRQLALLAGQRLAPFGQLVEATSLLLRLGLLVHEALAEFADGVPGADQFVALVRGKVGEPARGFELLLQVPRLFIQTDETIPATFELVELRPAEKVVTTGDRFRERACLLFRPFKVFGIRRDLLPDAVYLFELSLRRREVAAGDRERSGPRGRAADLLLNHVA